METKKWYDNAVMVNRDPNWIYRIKGDSETECKEHFEKFISQYEGAVTDVMFAVLEQTAMVPNNSFMWRGEKYLQKIENGHEVDYSSYETMYKAYTEYNFDGIQIFIDQMHKLGIRPWLTFRMNDAHFSSAETSFIHSDMFYEEIAAGHNTHERYAYYRNLFNWRYPRYKNAILNYIEELLGKYDIFGIELDFMREIYCFDYVGDPDGIQEIMLDYFREVKKRVTAAEKRLGHDLKISLRICRDPDEAYDLGFDVETMVREGLIDVLVPTGHFGSTDGCMPVRKWKKIVGDDIALIGGIETNNYKLTVNTPEHAKAYAASFYAQGADGIYFNNHEYYTDRNRASWRVNKENCHKGRREFTVTEQDYGAYDPLAFKPFPYTFVPKMFMPLELGRVKKTDKVTLIIDFDGPRRPIAEILGVVDPVGKDIEPLIRPALGDKTVNLTEHTPIAYDLSGFETDSKVIVSLIGKGTISYMSVIIESEEPDDLNDFSEK